MRKLFLLLLLLPVAYGQDLESKGTITVVIKNFRNDRGEIRVAIFNSKEGFPGNSKLSYKKVTATIKNRKAEVIFTDIPFGVYAIGVFHDENMNGEMDSNLLKIPKEGYGASNDARERFGPPKFEDAKFELNADSFVNINVGYMKLGRFF